ncbi:MAG: aryl-sulfate sulfotransferase [Solirubrobacterales bacterium]|nr:aryl-sulfate sulfotransferase [Solirubrobacterales bacterium]
MRPAKRTLGLLICGALLASLAIVGPAQAAIGSFTTKGAWSFASAPKLHPPKLRVIGGGRKHLARGFFMLANFKNLTLTKPMVGQSGPLIVDSHLQPVWFAPVPKNLLALNLKAQRYNGKPVLTYWEGVINNVGATVSGKWVVVGQNYKQLATLSGQGGWVLSEHELAISGGTAWVTAYKNVSMNLTPYGGASNGTLLDAAVQQYDLKTGKLLYNWDALAHIPLSQARQRPIVVKGHPVPWDAYHVNSIQLNGNRFLTSMRNTWAAYMVDMGSGGIVWTLGGSASSFGFGSKAAFQWQHDVELHPGNKVSIYDDHCCALLNGGKFQKPAGPSRGLVLKLDFAKHRATFGKQFLRGRKFNSAFLGNTQLLGGGNTTVGWGSQPFFSEYGKHGKLLLDVRWPGPDLSYRAYVQGWVGKPYFAPSGAVRTKRGKTTVFASWDGATQVAAWRVLAGNDAKHLKAVARANRSGFETAIGLGSSFKAYKLQALDRKGHVLRSSVVFGQKKTKGSSPGFY